MPKITEYPKATSFDENDVLLKDGVNGTKQIGVDDAAEFMGRNVIMINEEASAGTKVVLTTTDQDYELALMSDVDAVESEVGELKTQLDQTLPVLFEDFGVTYSPNIEYTSNQVPIHDGTFFTDTGAVQKWFGSGYIVIPNGVKTIRFCGINHSATSVTPIAFYNANKVFISCYSGSSSFAPVEGYISVPENAVYFYQSKYYAEGDTRNSNNYTAYIFGEKYNMENIQSVVNSIGDDDQKFNSDSYTSNNICLSNGAFDTYSGWTSTDYIYCKGRNKIEYDAYSYTNESTIDVAYVSFFDENKEFISGLLSSDTTTGEHIGIVNVPSGAYYVRGTRAADIDSYIKLEATGYVNAIKAGNPLTNGMTICCVGDSLTKGVDTGSHVIKENYPYFMSEYLNCNIINYGESGRSPYTWWENYKDIHTFNPNMDVVLIMFGTNGGLQTNTLATDVEPYNDWHDYADTNVGDYCKLIESIMDQTQNHAQIFILTAPYSTYTSAQEQLVINSAPTIRAIAQRYSLPVIDVLYESGMGKFNGNVFRPHDGCHFNAKGYHRLGTFIGSVVKSKISTFSLDDEYDDETQVTP